MRTCTSFRLIGPLLSCLMWGTASFARDPETGGSEEGPPPKVRFRVMGMERVVEDIGYFHDGEFLSFSASRSRPTRWMDFNGEGPLSFYNRNEITVWREASAEDPEVEKPGPVARFAPGRSGEWLLIFVRTSEPGEEAAYRIVAIPDQAEGLKEGLRYYNFTNRELAIQVTEELIRLNPGGRKHMNPPPGPHSAMEMKIAAEDGSGWELISSTVFGHRPNACITFYIFDMDGEVRIKRFLDKL